MNKNSPSKRGESQGREEDECKDLQMCHGTTDKSASKWFRMDRLQSSRARVAVVRDGAGKQVEGHAKVSLYPLGNEKTDWTSSMLKRSFQ